MSFARFGDDSDVYVFLSVSGYFECCGCALATDSISSTFRTTDTMIAHLHEHENAGHMVPSRTILRLEAEREENDAYIAAGGGSDIAVM